MDWSALVDGITWPDGVTAAVAVAALVVSVRSTRHSRRAADAGEATAAATVDAVRAAEVSAQAAKDSAREAADMARNDHEREHDRLGPGLVPTIVAELEQRPRGTGQTLFGEIQVPRGYRVRAEAVTEGGAHSSISLPLVLLPGTTHRFVIEEWAAGRKRPETAHVLFRFWPPVEGDDVETWHCPCNRPPVEGGVNGRGHWEWRAPIAYEPPAEPRMRWVG